MPDVPALLSELDDHGFADTSEDRKVSALNYAISNMSQRKPFWKFVEKVVTLDFDGVSATPSNVPADLRTVMKIMNGSQRIRPQRVDDMEESFGSQLGDSGDPLYYYFEGTELKLWRIPGSDVTLRLRYLQYAPRVTETSGAAAIIIPEDYHEALIFRALFRLYDLDDDPEMAGRMEAHYENVLAQMTEPAATQQLDAPDFIHVVDDDDWGDDFDL